VSRPHPALALSSGEPAGIGPELVAMLARRHASAPFPARIVVLGERRVLDERARRIGIAPAYREYDPAGLEHPGSLEIWDCPLAVRPRPGHPDPTNASAVLAMLRQAADACAIGSFDALVTAPVQKSVFADAGIPFMGHTEFLAQRAGVPRVVMMLVGGTAAQPLRVALVTTHLPLAAVPAAVTRAAVEETLAIVDADLRTRFGIAAPRLGVCGLNPHAGESGHLGREEIESIAPAIAALRAKGVDVTGPLPADTIFVPDHAKRFDAIVAMYHDQGLPVLKAGSFGGGINVTLGLPYVRTSVDHGTALDLAADAARAATADPGSLFAALDCAIDLAARAGR
jgi:4-hydroxythreonine-4-phosphate dehydrogenase